MFREIAKWLRWGWRLEKFFSRVNKGSQSAGRNVERKPKFVIEAFHFDAGITQFRVDPFDLDSRVAKSFEIRKTEK